VLRVVTSMVNKLKNIELSIRCALAVRYLFRIVT
jgi:hypothetical protein